jgi:hypothetical protein
MGESLGRDLLCLYREQRAQLIAIDAQCGRVGVE